MSSRNISGSHQYRSVQRPERLQLHRLQLEVACGEWVALGQRHRYKWNGSVRGVARGEKSTWRTGMIWSKTTLWSQGKGQKWEATVNWKLTTDENRDYGQNQIKRMERGKQ